MPKAVIALIVAGLVSGTWSLIEPRFEHQGSVAGVSTSSASTLPDLPILPTKIEKFQKPFINARNVAIVDVDSAYVLYEKDARQPVPIASLTKVMTAMLVLEQNELNDVVTISRNATQATGSIIQLRQDEKMLVRDLLYGLLLNSGNDAAVALAEHTAGTTDAFIEKMNNKAKQIGLRNTQFKDPAGLDDGGIASARDMGILLAYALRNEVFRAIVHTPQATITSVDGAIVHVLESSNRLVKEEMFYEGIIGGKTGFTPAAGHNMVAAATRDDHTVVAVIINTFASTKEASATEARRGLDWAFTNHVWLPYNQ